jgi:hypothetical protein
MEDKPDCTPVGMRSDFDGRGPRKIDLRVADKQAPSG